MEQKNVLCLGYINLDIVIHVNEKLQEEKSARSETVRTFGGGVANTGSILANRKEISNVWLVGDVGTDRQGNKVYNELQENNVELAVPRTDNRTTKINSIVEPDARPKYTHENTEIDIFSVDDVQQEIWNKVDHLHTSTFDADAVEEFVEKANDENVTVSLNPTQGFSSVDFTDVYPHVDLIQMNRQESEIFQKRNGPLGSLVNQHDVDVIVTHGPAGSSVYSKNGVENHPGYTEKVEQVVDTIGAGDSFMAGFLLKWLQNKDLKTCLKYGNAFGTASVTKKGGPNKIEESHVNNIINDDK